MNDEDVMDTADTEVFGQSGGRIGGTSRIESAWSGDSEAASTASAGTIFEQIYRPWEGGLGGRWARNYAMLRHHLYGIFSKGHRPWSMPTRLVILIMFLGSLTDLLMVFIASLSGISELMEMWGVNRSNLYAHVLGYFPRNAFCFPLVAAILAGGMISEDRRYGLSAIYFSRPVSRIDYAAMKFLSMAIILGIVMLFTLCMYYSGAILLTGEGWNYLLDTFPIFVKALVAGSLMVITYTSLGLAFSSVSQGRFMPAVALIGLLLGTRLIGTIVRELFERSIFLLLSPYDVVAHIAQVMMGIEGNYSHSWTWSLVSLVLMNAISLYVVAVRITSMEVTRE